MLIVANTAAAPLISPFIIACDGSDGFSEIPPESYITPLPTMTKCGLPFAPVGLYVNRTMRGGSTLPRFTPMIPPHPMASNWSLLNTSTLRPDSPASATALLANIVAVRCAGGMFAKSRAILVAVAITMPRFTPATSAAPAPTIVTSESLAAFLSTVFKSVYRCVARAIPSTTTWAAILRSILPALAKSVAKDGNPEAARASAAEAFRSVSVVSFAFSPMPTKIVIGPFSEGTTYVWPTLPAKPSVPSVFREREIPFGRAPSDVTATPTAATPTGILLATVNDIGFPF